MRTREQIEGTSGFWNEKQLEVLLDIRELLSHPPHSRPATEEEAATFLEMFTPVSEKDSVEEGTV